jgi:hypothetical protein
MADASKVPIDPEPSVIDTVRLAPMGRDPSVQCTLPAAS